MTHLPWMQIYIGDELAETSALSPEEYGCHMRLRLHQWMHGELPSDEERLRRICAADREQWATVREALAPLFDWQWHHIKTAELRRQSEELRQIKVENGRKGGRPRKGPEKLNETETKPTAKANGKADEKLNETQSPSPSALPSPSAAPAPSAAHAPPPKGALDKRGDDDLMRRFPVPESVDAGTRFLQSRGCPPDHMKRCLGMLMEGHLSPFDIEEWDVRAKVRA